ncbi:uncharacterized protein LOC113282068 [Papaver somniferum]|nr:uncharacterized protein LOC113282068 [Papaver somniferum]
MQQEKYQLAEELYRKALSIEPDKNKQCNLAICLMHRGRITEVKSLLETVKAEPEFADSYVKSFDCATEMLSELNSGPALKPLEQKKDDSFKMETLVKVNSSSRYVVGERGLEHSDSQKENETVCRSYNLNSEATYHQLSLANDIEYNLQKEFEVFDINGEFRKSAARGGSLYSDQKKYLYSTNRHECAGNLQVLKEIPLQEDSAEKDMALVMKQAIKAIKSFRSLCSRQSQESLDNVLIDLYKKSGGIGQHIELLERKLQLLEDGGNKSRCCSVHHEKSRLLGNLGWAYMQKKNYKVADEFYRKALSLEPDEKSNECNLAICFIQKERIRIAKSLLQNHVDGGRGLVPSYMKCLDNSHPSKGQHQNHGLGGKWTGKDPRLRVSDMNGSDSSFGQDMVEKEEEKEDSLSLFSSENTIESVSEWSSSEDSSYISQETDIRLLVVDDLNDAEDTLQKQFEAVGINGEFRNYKRGTVIIVFLDASKLYVVSDSRLSYEFINPDTKVKEYRICYRNKVKCEGLHVKVEEVGEKITACEGFLTALAGNYKIAHHVCENLKQMWINEEIGSDHRFFAERLEDHSTDTDFILVTPTNMGGFQISSVKDNGVRPMVGKLLCLGSGAGLAEKIILEKLKTRNQEISTVEMLKEVVHEVCGEEKTVGGVVTVAVSEVVGESDKDKRLKTEFFRFPPLKRV